MATKDIWKPGLIVRKTPAGHEMAVPVALAGDELEAALAAGDVARAEDPAAIERDRKLGTRKAIWQKQVDEAKAWRAHLDATLLKDGAKLPADFDHEKERAAFVRVYRRNLIVERTQREFTQQAEIRRSMEEAANEEKDFPF